MGKGGKGRGTSREFEFQGHWLGQEAGSDSWYAYWYDAERRRTCRRSLDEVDLERAKVALVTLALERVKPVQAPPDAVSLGQVLVQYLAKTDRQPCGLGYRSAARYIAEFWGGSLISHLSQARQREFIDWLGAKGFSPAYIKRIMGIVSGALGHAVENDVLVSRPHIIMAVSKISERVDRPARTSMRRLTVDELAAFIDAIQAPHLLRYTLLAMNTVARPEAILDLRWSQIGNDGLLMLNPPGRKQTKKHRPTIPLTDTLAAWLRAWQETANDGYIVHFHGKPIDDPRLGIQDIAIRAGLLTDDDFEAKPGARSVKRERSIHPYTFRRSMARILRGRGVSMEDLGAWMGHRIPHAATTEVFYADADPAYLAHVRATIDGVMVDIGARLKSTPIRPAPVDAANPEWWTRRRLYGSI